MKKITIKAEVIDNISVKDVFVHFSPTDKQPLSKEGSSDTYTIKGIWGKNAGYIRFYLTATDEAGNENKSVVRNLKIIELRHHGIWLNYVLSNDAFKDDTSALDWDRFSLTYLHERNPPWVFGAQLDFSDFMRRTSNLILTGQLGFQVGETPIGMGVDVSRSRQDL